MFDSEDEFLVNANARADIADPVDGHRRERPAPVAHSSGREVFSIFNEGVLEAIDEGLQAGLNDVFVDAYSSPF